MPNVHGLLDGMGRYREVDRSSSLVAFGGGGTTTFLSPSGDDDASRSVVAGPTSFRHAASRCEGVRVGFRGGARRMHRATPIVRNSPRVMMI